MRETSNGEKRGRLSTNQYLKREEGENSRKNNKNNRNQDQEKRR